METLKCQIENCIEQTKMITAKYPKIKSISFRIHNCSLAEITAISDEYDDETELRNNKMSLCICGNAGNSASYFIHLESKPLIVSKPIIVEE